MNMMIPKMYINVKEYHSYPIGSFIGEFGGLVGILVGIR